MDLGTIWRAENRAGRPVPAASRLVPLGDQLRRTPEPAWNGIYGSAPADRNSVELSARRVYFYDVLQN